MNNQGAPSRTLFELCRCSMQGTLRAPYSRTTSEKMWGGPGRPGADCGTGVLLVEHHADLIFDICDQVTVLNLGRELAAGTPAHIRSHKEVVSAYLGA